MDQEQQSERANAMFWGLVATCVCVCVCGGSSLGLTEALRLSTRSNKSGLISAPRGREASGAT